MAVEQGLQPSPLDLIHETFRAQQVEDLLDRTSDQFTIKALSLMKGSPLTIEKGGLNGKTIWPYIEPVKTSVPHIAFQTSDGEILLRVEGEYKTDTNQGLKLKKIALFFEKEGESSSLTVEYDDDREPIKETLPSAIDLLKGIEVLEYMMTLRVPATSI